LAIVCTVKINRSTDIALRIAMLVAVRNDRMTVEELATELAVPRNHIAKIVQRLQRTNVLVTTRGRAGGVELAADARHVTVGYVVRAFEGEGEVVDCATPPCPLRHGCRLRSVLHRAQQAFLATLDDVPLDELIAAPTGPILLGLTAPSRS
jgi:Rrf2 family nitric oxide-sensitive transcriptional repressor